MSDPDSQDQLQSKVWILRGLSNDPAILTMAGERLVLQTADRIVFDVEINNIEVSFPRIQFDGGCRVGVNDQVHKISFVRPNGAADLPAHVAAELLGGVVGLGAALTKVRDIGQGRAAGKTWKAVLVK